MTVRIPSRAEAANVECVAVDDDEINFTLEDAQWTLAAWMQVESRPYYRAQVRSRQHSSTTRFVTFYEPGTRRGHYAALRSGGESVALTNLHAPGVPWDEAILDLMVAAEEEDARSGSPVEQASS